LTVSSIHQDIQGALQLAAADVAGFPAANQRAYDNVGFQPTKGTPWARLVFQPQPARPFAIKGLSRLYGMFQVSVFLPAGHGTDDATALADAVVAAYPTDRPLVHGAARVQILSAGRTSGIPEADFYQVPVLVSWQCLTAS
jgi:hypothetical protein